MSKWADYVITAVRFNMQGTHIDQVQIHEDKGDTIGDAQTYGRQAIVDAIKKNITFVTAFIQDSKWQLGKSVYIVPINGSEYIKTVADNKLVDNLDNLPTF